jgi:hypothetical protein
MFDADIFSPGPDDVASTATEAPLGASSRVVADVADRVGPAVVGVESRGAGRPGGTRSGVIIAGDGLAENGVGYGLTPRSDRLMAKMIIGTDLAPGCEPTD